MCGIFAYLNYQRPQSRKAILQTLVCGLRRLEYRGYDSAGVGIDDEEGRPTLIKKTGNVNQLEACIESNERQLDMDRIYLTHVGISHTRWATHGPPSDINAHPQPSDPTNEFVVVHNGIITNYDVLRKFLQTHGHKFLSETDTEVIAKLCKYMWDQHEGNVSFTQLVMEVLHKLEGAYALLFKSIHFPGSIVACKRGSPLILGIKKSEEKASFLLPSAPQPREQDMTSLEIFLASDASAIVEHTRKVIYMEDDDIVHVDGGNVHTYNFNRETRELVNNIKTVNTLELELESIMKGNFPHFMLKEIYDQPESTANTMRGRVNFDDAVITLGGIKGHADIIRRSRRLMMFACGTSYHSALAARIAIEGLTNIPVVMELASDFQDRTPPIYRDDVCCFISQSGETKDTLNALEYCLSKGAFCVGFTNTVGSAIARKTHCGVHINAGAEIGVASTKAYTSQILALLMFGLMVSVGRRSTATRRTAVIAELQKLPSKIKEALKLDGQIKSVAAEIKNSRSMLLMGRGYQYATCLEGALKIKEISYIHSEGIHTGELNHGPLALVSEDLPVIMVCTTDASALDKKVEAAVYDKMEMCLEQVLKRKGKPIVITDHNTKEIGAKAYQVITVPQTIDCLQPIINIIPLQLLSYHLAVLRGQNVDCPRNLAKSVTV